MSQDVDPQFNATYPKPRPFLLMEGGPLYRLEQRLGLVKKYAPLTKRRALFAALLAWLPLLILSAVQGMAFGHNVPVPFLHDFSAYTRFLLALPLLLIAELIIGPRIAETASHFITSGIIPQSDYPRFSAAIDNGLRLRDSVVAELVIIVLAYINTAVAFHYTKIHVSTWYAIQTGRGDATNTLAGWWLLLVSTPLYHFLLLRWLWRIFLWFRFLATASNLHLQLFPTHPDEAGGLGFIGEAQRFFGMLMFSYSLGIAGVIANAVLYDKTPLTRYAPAIAIYAICALLVLVAPLGVFTGRLIRTKREGMHRYGTLATTYTGSFHRKWIDGENPQQDPLLGTGDIQSLADLGNSYSFIEKMNPLPIDLASLVHLVVATLLPMTPLLLTVMPFKEVIKLLMKVLV